MLTEEQKKNLINAHRNASQALADVRVIIDRVQHGQTDAETLEAERLARKVFNEADREFMDLVLYL